MKNLLIIILAIVSFSCSERDIKRGDLDSDIQVLYRKPGMMIYKIEVDSIEYIVFDGYRSVAVVKHK